jgi:hypothetical protein
MHQAFDYLHELGQLDLIEVSCLLGRLDDGAKEVAARNGAASQILICAANQVRAGGDGCSPKYSMLPMP